MANMTANMQHLPTLAEIEAQYLEEYALIIAEMTPGEDAMGLEQYPREENAVFRCNSEQVAHCDWTDETFEIQEETPETPETESQKSRKPVNKLWVAAGVAVLFAAYQVYNLYNNFRIWMSSGTTRAQDDDPTGNPQCHSVIAAETFHPIAMLVTLLLHVGLSCCLRKPSDKELSRKLQSTESEVRKLRNADRSKLTEQKQAVNEAIKQTTDMWKTRCDQLTRKLEAEHREVIDKLNVEIEGLKKTDDTNTDWHHQANKAENEIGQIKAQIEQLKAQPPPPNLPPPLPTKAKMEEASANQAKLRAEDEALKAAEQVEQVKKDKMNAAKGNLLQGMTGDHEAVLRAALARRRVGVADEDE
jgi:hypothetical protein